MGRRHQREWIWDLAVPPATIWPLISDTARFNEAAGTPRYSVEEIPQPDGSVRRNARASYKGVAVEWDDPPYEWIVEREFRQNRVFRRGPLARLSPTMELRPLPSGGSRVTYRLVAEPRGLVGFALFATGFLDTIGKGIEEMIRHAARFAEGDAAAPFEYEPPRLGTEQTARLAVLARRLAESPYSHGLSDRLAAHITDGQEVDLVHIRPRNLARTWRAPLRDVIELCLEATRLGMLNLSWNLLCPRCGGAKLGATSLGQLPGEAHCSSCNIAYDGKFTENVEISFRPAPGIRAVGEGEFCMGGPHVSRHILVQQILGPGESRELEARLPSGEYRLRALEPGGECRFVYDGAEFPAIVATDAAAPGFSITAGPPMPPGHLRFENRSRRQLTLVVESRAWRSDALTAHEVTTLQAFRDLLPEQVLRPGEDVGIDNITLMFTDLEGSTALYERLGDGAAYRLVRRHFAFLADTIRAHDGALVKTIGDAVMAAFARPEQAVLAALEIRDRIGRFNADYRVETEREGNPVSAALVLKVGLHSGRCIAVNLNDRLDYFGSTVNMAARLQGRSQGGEVVLSAVLADDPAVVPLLIGRPARREAAALKGFDRPVPFVRLTG